MLFLVGILAFHGTRAYAVFRIDFEGQRSCQMSQKRSQYCMFQVHGQTRSNISFTLFDPCRNNIAWCVPTPMVYWSNRSSPCRTSVRFSCHLLTLARHYSSSRKQMAYRSNPLTRVFHNPLAVVAFCCFHFNNVTKRPLLIFF